MKRILITLAVLFTLSVVFSACGSSRSHCNTKGKSRVEMGWM